LAQKAAVGRASRIGNVLVQARTAGALTGDIEVLRRLVADSAEPVRYQPRPGSSRMTP
jgi:rhamnulokinase